MIGDLDTLDTVLRPLTNLVRCVTVSIDYRLAPEHVFPAAVDDAYAVKWVHQNASIPARHRVRGDRGKGILLQRLSILRRRARRHARRRAGAPSPRAERIQDLSLLPGPVDCRSGWLFGQPTSNDASHHSAESGDSSHPGPNPALRLNSVSSKVLSEPVSCVSCRMRARRARGSMPQELMPGPSP